MITYLYLEPYVFIETSIKEVLFYNSLSGCRVKICRSAVIDGIVKRLNDVNSYRMSELTHTELLNEGVDKLISDLRKYFMADLFSTSGSSKCPIQIYPIKDHYLNLKDKKGDFYHSKNDQLTNELRELTFHLNNSKGDSSLLNNLKDQIIYPHIGEEYKELDFSLIKKVIQKAQESLSKVNFIGGAIGSYTHLSDLINFCMEVNYEVNWVFHYTGIQDVEIKSQFRYKVLVNNPIDIDDLNLVISNLSAYENVEFIFIIADGEDIPLFDSIVEKHNLFNSSYLPVFTENNYALFAEHVFLSKGEIEALKPSEDEVLANMTLNYNFFGKLIIDEAGLCYTQKDSRIQIDVATNSLSEIVYEQHSEHSDWFLKRSESTECKGCVNSFICPPISAVELALKRLKICK